MKYLFTIIFLFRLTLCMAQEEMSTKWSQNPDHRIEFIGLDDAQGQYTYGSSNKEITVYNNDGKAIWSKKYSEIAPELNKVDEIVPLWNAGAIFIFDRKTGKDQMAVIDVKTGNALWTSDKYQGVTDENLIYIPEVKTFAVATKDALIMLESLTGKELWRTTRFKGTIGKYIYQDGNIVMLNYQPSNLTGFFKGFKNQLVRVNSTTGQVLWEQTYKGKIEKKVVTREAVCEIKMDKGHLLLMLNGLQVFDYETGKLVWAAAYDLTPDVVKSPGVGYRVGYGMGIVNRFGAYGTVASPIMTDAYLYVLDFDGKRNQYVKKYDKTTGKLLWTSPEIKDARSVPSMFMFDNVIVLQVGGYIERQYVRTFNSSTGAHLTEHVVDYVESSPYNLQAFDAETGKLLWESDGFKKGITNSFTEGSNLIICSGKALFSMDGKTGKVSYEVALKDDKIGEATYIVNYNDKVAIVGEKGVSTHSKTNGALIATSKYKKSSPVRINGQLVFGNYMAMRTEGGDYAVYNLNTCKYKSYDARKNSQAFLSQDGKSLYTFESGGTFSKSIINRMNTED